MNEPAFERLVDVVQENTVAMSNNTSATNRLAEKIDEGKVDTNKVLTLMHTREPMFQQMQAGIAGIPAVAKASRDHTEGVVKAATERVRWYVVWATTALALSALFGGAGTRLLEWLKFLPK